MEWLLFLELEIAFCVTLHQNVECFWLCIFDYIYFFESVPVTYCYVATVTLLLPSYENPQIPFTLMTCCKNQIYFKITYKVEVAGFGPQKYFMLFKRIISACISEWASFQKQALVFFKHCQNLSRMHVTRICILWFSKKPQAELNALIRVLPNASYS